jgi:hypothetical protein
MLYEIKNISQKEKDRFRRWFGDDFFDLIVWYDTDKIMRGFQLCYDKYGIEERVLTWKTEHGFNHDIIDEGRNKCKIPMTPILIEGGQFPAVLVLKKFKDACARIDNDVSKLVMSKMIEYIRTSKRAAMQY